jgi:hypothetical protein
MLRRLADKLLRDRNAELEAELQARDRIIAVKDAEIQSLAAVVARDRERVKAEAAAYARQRAECEGTHGRTS